MVAYKILENESAQGPARGPCLEGAFFLCPNSEEGVIWYERAR